MMKSLKFLLVVMSAIMLSASSPVLAEFPPDCTGNSLGIGLFADPTIVKEGEFVEFIIVVSNPNSLGTECEAYNLEVRFWDPTVSGDVNSLDICPSPNDTVIATELNLNRGEFAVFTSADPGAGILQYIANKDDADANGIITTYACAIGDANTPIPATARAENDISIQIIAPNTVTDISASAMQVSPGEMVDLTVTEENTGDDPLTDPCVLVDDGTFTIAILVAPPDSGDDGNNVLDPCETWSWDILDVVVSTTTTFTATGHGIDSMGVDITYPDYPGERAQVTVQVRGDATRTPGFWKTHCLYTQTVLGYLGGTINLGWKILDSPADVFGMFWAKRTYESNGDRRDRVCHAQMIGSFQLLAAILNTGLPNGAAVPIDPQTSDDLITAMRNALANCDRPEILRLNSLLDYYNNSGDDVEIEDDVPHADPKCARDLADVSIADCIECD